MQRYARPLVFVAMFLAAGLATWLVLDRMRVGNETAAAFGGPFSLVTMNGDPVTEQAFRGNPSAVFFGFTHCPEVCPTTLYELDGWLKKLGDDGSNIKAWFVSVDPERDTPEVLGDYVSSVSDRITGITGDPEKVRAMYQSFRIFARKVDTDDGSYTMDHTASIMLLDSNGGLVKTIAWGENPDTALEKLRQLNSL